MLKSLIAIALLVSVQTLAQQPTETPKTPFQTLEEIFKNGTPVKLEEIPTVALSVQAKKGYRTLNQFVSPNTKAADLKPTVWLVRQSLNRKVAAVPGGGPLIPGAAASVEAVPALVFCGQVKLSECALAETEHESMLKKYGDVKYKETVEGLTWTVSSANYLARKSGHYLIWKVDVTENNETKTSYSYAWLVDLQ
jgi:hypothetical protein